MVEQKNVIRGKKSRASGADFERRVRKDLTEEGWIVDKWSNNVSDVFEQDIGEYVRELIPAKNKWAGPGRPMMMGAGFPDFIAFKIRNEWKHPITEDIQETIYSFIGVECKVGKYLDKIEKEKCQWLLDNKIFSKIIIAYKTKEKNRVKVNYIKFQNGRATS